MANNPSFISHRLFATLLCLNMLGLWGYSGAGRARTKTTPNPEDLGRAGRQGVVRSVVHRLG